MRDGEDARDHQQQVERAADHRCSKSCAGRPTGTRAAAAADRGEVVERPRRRQPRVRRAQHAGEVEPSHALARVRLAAHRAHRARSCGPARLPFAQAVEVHVRRRARAAARRDELGGALSSVRRQMRQAFEEQEWASSSAELRCPSIAHFTQLVATRARGPAAWRLRWRASAPAAASSSTTPSARHRARHRARGGAAPLLGRLRADGVHLDGEFSGALAAQPPVGLAAADDAARRRR